MTNGELINFITVIERVARVLEEASSDIADLSHKAHKAGSSNLHSRLQEARGGIDVASASDWLLGISKDLLDELRATEPDPVV